MRILPGGCLLKKSNFYLFAVFFFISKLSSQLKWEIYLYWTSLRNLIAIISVTSGHSVHEIAVSQGSRLETLIGGRTAPTDASCACLQMTYRFGLAVATRLELPVRPRLRSRIICFWELDAWLESRVHLPHIATGEYR